VTTAVVAGTDAVGVVTDEAETVVTGAGVSGIEAVGSVAGAVVPGADVSGMLGADSVVSGTDAEGTSVDTAGAFEVVGASAIGSAAGGSVLSEALAVRSDTPRPIVVPIAAAARRVLATRVRVKFTFVPQGKREERGCNRRTGSAWRQQDCRRLKSAIVSTTWGHAGVHRVRTAAPKPSTRACSQPPRARVRGCFQSVFQPGEISAWHAHELTTDRLS
jgi:hypothetical protein